jgi:DNA anti-recombination protein RmuC
MATDPGVTADPVSTVAETKNQSTEPIEANEATADAGQKPETVEVNEKDPEVKRLQRELRKAQRINSRLYQESESLRSQAGKTEEPKATDDKADPVQMARLIAKVERFAETSNKLVEEGTSKYGQKYMDSLRELHKEVGDFVNRDGTPTQFMEAVLEVSDKPSELLKYLGDNPDISEELANLSPYKLAKKLDRIEREMADDPKSKISSAPKPIEPVKSGGKAKKDPSDMTFDEFTAWRLEHGARRRR